jgi:hypothetical protein
LLRGACHRARIRATRWLAMTEVQAILLHLSNSAFQETRFRILAARCARGLHQFHPPSERRAQGKPDADCTRGRAHKKAHEWTTGSTGSFRLSLREWFTAYFALSPVTGLSCHRRPRAALAAANLAPASGRQDHTTSPSASVPFVKGTSASTASRPAFRDERERPSCRVETGRACSGDLPDGLSGIFFS